MSVPISTGDEILDAVLECARTALASAERNTSPLARNLLIQDAAAIYLAVRYVAMTKNLPAMPPFDEWRNEKEAA